MGFAAGQIVAEANHWSVYRDAIKCLVFTLLGATNGIIVGVILDAHVKPPDRARIVCKRAWIWLFVAAVVFFLLTPVMHGVEK